MKNSKIIGIAFLLFGCPDNTNDSPPGDETEEADASADTDADSDTDANTDTNIILETDSITDTFADTDIGCLEGDYIITNESDALSLFPYTCINGNLTVEAPGLTSLNLPGMISVLGLAIKGNNVLVSINLSSITSVYELGIVDNVSLTSIEGLENLGFIDGGLYIYNNAALASLNGLDNLTGVDGDVGIIENNALTSLTGLGNLASIGGVLYIVDNTVLTSLNGLDNLAIVKTYLNIHDNAVLMNLDGLNNLTTVNVDGALPLHSPNALTSLIGLGLGELETEQHQFVDIYSNPALPQCEACGLIGQLIDFSGSFSFYSNQSDLCSDDCQ